jgi:hypothetical protein
MTPDLTAASRRARLRQDRCAPLRGGLRPVLTQSLLGALIAHGPGRKAAPHAELKASLGLPTGPRLKNGKTPLSRTEKHRLSNKPATQSCPVRVQTAPCSGIIVAEVGSGHDESHPDGSVRKIGQVSRMAHSQPRDMSDPVCACGHGSDPGATRSSLDHKAQRCLSPPSSAWTDVNQQLCWPQCSCSPAWAA